VASAGSQGTPTSAVVAGAGAGAAVLVTLVIAAVLVVLSRRRKRRVTLQQLHTAAIASSHMHRDNPLFAMRTRRSHAAAGRDQPPTVQAAGNMYENLSGELPTAGWSLEWEEDAKAGKVWSDTPNSGLGRPAETPDDGMETYAQPNAVARRPHTPAGMKTYAQPMAVARRPHTPAGMETYAQPKAVARRPHTPADMETYAQPKAVARRLHTPAGMETYAQPKAVAWRPHTPADMEIYDQPKGNVPLAGAGMATSDQPTRPGVPDVMLRFRASIQPAERSTCDDAGAVAGDATVCGMPTLPKEACAERADGSGAGDKYEGAGPAAGPPVRGTPKPRCSQPDIALSDAGRAVSRISGPPGAPWNHGDIDRREAERRLLAAGTQKGLYLARQKASDVLAFSVVVAGTRGLKVVHHLLELQPDGTYTIDGGAKGSCGSLEEAVPAIATAQMALCRPGQTPAELESAA